MGDVEHDEHGRPEPRLAAGEAETLLAFLDHQRATLAWTCAGLDDDQLRTRLHPTSMTLGGLLKHLARVEDGWFQRGRRGGRQSLAVGRDALGAGVGRRRRRQRPPCDRRATLAP